jgi:excisionase family DNA binding protein
MFPVFSDRLDASPCEERGRHAILPTIPTHLRKGLNEMAPEDLLNVDQLAAYVGVKRAAVYHWVANGNGPTVLHAGRQLRFRRSDVDAWLAEAPTKAKAQA